MAFELSPYPGKQRKPRHKPGKDNSNLIVIFEECQLCASTARAIGCSRCDTRLCEECIEYFNGQPMCNCCRDEFENPTRLAKVLMFPRGTA